MPLAARDSRAATQRTCSLAPRRPRPNTRCDPFDPRLSMSDDQDRDMMTSYIEKRCGNPHSASPARAVPRYFASPDLASPRKNSKHPPKKHASASLPSSQSANSITNSNSPYSLPESTRQHRSSSNPPSSTSTPTHPTRQPSPGTLKHHPPPPTSTNSSQNSD
jgi:hypothetical protein